MKSIEALKALHKLPTGVRWFTLYFDCYENAAEFCSTCFSKESMLV